MSAVQPLYRASEQELRSGACRGPSGPRPLRGEAVAHSGLGPQVSGVGGVRLKLASELGKVDAEVVRLLLVARTPHRLQQLTLADQPAGMTGQGLQQPPLDRRKADRNTAHGDLAVDQVDGEVV